MVSRLQEETRRLAASPDWPLLSTLLLGLVALVESVVYADAADTMLLAFMGTLPLAARRNHLPAVAVVVTLATLFVLADENATWTVSGIIGQLCVAYLVAERYPRRWSLLLALPVLANAIAPFNGYEDGLARIMPLVLVSAALALGDSRKLRGEAIAERDATRDAIAESQRDQAAMEERARIARELHDIVAHHVSVIAVQAETARLTTPGMPDEGKKRLEESSQTARDSLTELRRLLGLLRDDAGTTPERAPQPGLDLLDELIDTARAAGAQVRLILKGNVVPLPPGVDLTAYRILQEALTNARRHAPGAAVDVELRYTGDTLHLRVSDNGPGPPETDPGGHGLLGMRERAVMFGGSLQTGPADDGGFAVTAELPIRRPAA
jgi:signal transduction histidine kinase